ILARAHIASRDVAAASRDLRSLVESSDAAGHRSVRRSAGLALQSARRRLPPVAGSGWDALSTREREVAEHLLRGHDVDEIARLMFLTPGTVRTHLSRVLCAFGVPTRIGFLATARRPEGEPPTPAPAELSARQCDVAALVATGARNHEIAETLGISTKSVEKHVSDVLTRWQIRSRFGIARIWWASQP
ncbi:MAG: LuxR family transcriptional regulator, partial [Myxococcales bacterium]